MDERLNTHHAQTQMRENVYSFIMGNLISKSVDDDTIPPMAYGLMFSKLFYKFEDFDGLINRLKAEFPDDIEKISFLESISDLVVTSASKLLDDVVVNVESPVLSVDEVNKVVMTTVTSSEDLKDAANLVSGVPEILSCGLDEIKDKVESLLESEKGRIENENEDIKNTVLSIEGEGDDTPENNIDSNMADAANLEIYRTPMFTEVVENPVSSIYNRLAPALMDSEAIQARVGSMNKEELTELIRNSMQTTIKVVIGSIYFCNILHIPCPGLEEMCTKLTDNI
ncbi:MAG: hypothetical protein ACRCX2_15665 [Paraclostridium sp.]